MFRHRVNKQRLCDIPGFSEDVVSTLVLSTELGRQHAVGVIMALAMEREHQGALVAAGVFEAMVGLLGSPSVPTRAQAIAALWNFCTDDPDNIRRVRCPRCCTHLMLLRCGHSS